MTAGTRAKQAAKGSAAPPSKRPKKAASRKSQRDAALRKANRRRRQIEALKADARSGRRGASALLADPRAREVKVLTLLSMIPRCSLELALEALLACQINGARPCGALSATERDSIDRALFQSGTGIAPPPARAMPGRPEGGDRELDRVLQGARVHAPSVELAPSEFAAARAGLESDPLLLRMVDRLVDAVRLYAEEDDGGVRARVVAKQWIRFRNYRARVRDGELPPPTQRGPAVLE